MISESALGCETFFVVVSSATGVLGARHGQRTMSRKHASGVSTVGRAHAAIQNNTRFDAL